MLLEFLRTYMSEETAAILFPIIFVVLFLAIGGASLYLTPRIANWLDSSAKKNKNFYDGMLEHDPNDPDAAEAEETVKEGEE